VAIRQVFFDLNGTLLDPAAMGAPLRGRDAEQTAKDILREAVMLSMAETLTGSYRDFSQLLRAAAERHLTLAGEWDRLDEVTSASQRMWPFPDAATSIETLRWVGIGAGVLTNSSSAAATSLLARAELELEPVLGTDQVHAFKPDPRVYRLAVEAAGSAASELAGTHFVPAPSKIRLRAWTRTLSGLHAVIPSQGATKRGRGAKRWDHVS
jgi:2-haloacid dehalogenase